MKKFLRIALLAALMLPLGAHATTDTLIVADGNVYDGFIPVYGYYADADQHNQIIYPASMLTEMVGQNITSMFFYTTGSWSCQATIRLAIVSDSVLTGLRTGDSLTQVWSGTIASGVEHGFAVPFAYNGGNLLVDIQTVAAGYSQSSCVGIARDGASYYQYEWDSDVEDFLPKTRFLYSSDAFCYQPTALTFDAATTTSLTFHWTAGDSETSWDVMVGDSLIEAVTYNQITVTDLASSSPYQVKVRSVCGTENTSSWTAPVYMKTACASISNLPHTFGFEGDTDGELPYCWSTPSSISALEYGGADTNFFVRATANPSYSNYSHTGNMSLFSYIYTGYGIVEPGPGIIASPYIAHDPTDLHVTFWLASNSFPYGVQLEVGVMTDVEDSSTFIPLTNITPDDLSVIDWSYTYTQFEFYTSQLELDEDDSVCIAFRISMNSYAQSYYFYIDDITVDAMGDCLPPTLNSGSVDSVSYEAVALSWECAGEPDGYSVRLVPFMGGNTVYSYTTDTEILIDELPGNTRYDAYAASVCGDDTTSYVFIGTFTTHYRCYPVQNAAVVALTANAAALAWNYAGAGIEPGSTTIVLTDMTDTTVAPVTVEVTGINSVFSGLTENHVYTATFTTYCGSSDTSETVSVSFLPHTPPCAEYSGSESNDYLPLYSLYNNGFSEMLYAGTDVAGVDTLTGLTFEVSSPLNRDNIIDIWMGYVSDSITGLSYSAGGYIPVSQMTHVVSNFSLNTANEGWTDIIPFDTAFTTQATGNLIVAVYNHTGSWSSGLQWASHTSTVGPSAYCYTDSPISPEAPFDLGTVGTSSNAANIQFYGTCGGGSCLAPGVSVASVEVDNVTLSWLPGGSETSWPVQYRASGTTAWTTYGIATTAPYTLTGLNPATPYQFRVGADCGDTVVYSSVVNATTLCGSMHAPFSIYPDGTNACWSYLGNGYVYNGYYIYSNGAIVSPAIADTISTLQLRVNVYGSPYYVGVCNEDASVVTWLDTVDPGSSYDYHYMKTYLHNYTGTDNHVIIRATEGFNYVYFNEITIEPLDPCLFVENLTLDSVTTSEAWLSWTSGGNNFEVSYLRQGDSIWSAPITATTNSVHLTGLASNDRYYVKVFNVCSATSRSDSTMIRFATGCTAYPLPFFEGFGMFELPVCWNAVAPANSYTSWQQSIENGGTNIYSQANSSPNPSGDWLMTPNIQLPADASIVQLIYRAGGGPSTYMSNSQATYEVLVSTTGNGDIANYIDTLLFDTVDTYNNVNYSYSLNTMRLNLGAYNGQTVSFAFHNTSTANGTVYLSQIEVREVINPVYTVTGNNSIFLGDTAWFQAVYQEGSMAGMTLTWHSTMADEGHATIHGSNSDSMYVYYTADGVDTLTLIATNNYGSDTVTTLVFVYDCAPVSQFPYHEGFETQAAPAGCWTMLYATDNPPAGNLMQHMEVGGDSYLTGTHEGNRAFRFSSYSSSDDYNQYLISRELNGTNMTLSFWYIKGSYGDASQDNIRVGYSSTDRDTNSFTWGPWITGISISDWAHYTDSIPDGTKYVAIQYWGDFAYYIYIDDFTIDGTSACQAPAVTSVVPGEEELTVNFESEAESVEIIVSLGGFDPDAESVIVSGNSYTATGLIHSSDYTIALRSLCGEGMVSDWNLVTTSTLEVSCQAPTALNVTATGYNSVSLAWTPAGDEQAWQVNLYNTTIDTTVTVTTPSATINGLPAGTAFSASVRALCGMNSNIEGPYSEPITVSTDVCLPVENINVVPAANSAEVSWTSTGNTYRVVWGEQPFNPQDLTGEANVNVNSYTISNLTPLTAYAVVVYNNCTEGLSMASDPVNFTTLEGSSEGIGSVNGGNFSIYPNPASSSVTLGLEGFEGDVKVEVVDMNGRTVYNVNTTSSTVSIDVHEMPQGAYFVRLTSGSRTAVSKLIVK